MAIESNEFRGFLLICHFELNAVRGMVVAWNIANLVFAGFMLLLLGNKQNLAENECDERKSDANNMWAQITLWLFIAPDILAACVVLDKINKA